ncbi:MAG: MBL fold metallo-hydrolase [Bacteroides sp.]|jgi:7,8-dihydropterin-6-yl-methyl-4-(beta-D-ribofuranosyl)aminobenzene 5'-phosphate synthase|nr:MBL fold metallo-hydrolase [Bacteroides sp.]
MYKITTLVENCVYGRQLQSEHGLSLFIETPAHKLLFDTGASDLFIRNARFLNINLEEVDYLILSHGHSDHTGGLRSFLKLNAKATVICKHEILYPKFKGERENGITNARDLDLSRFNFIDKTTEIVPNVFAVPLIEISNAEDTHFDHFLVCRNEGMLLDTFEDELVLVLTDARGISVISACSHRGITNIMRTVRKSFLYLPCQLLLGGFHIHNAGQQKFEIIADYLQKDAPCQIGVCHCTGVDQYAFFQQRFGNSVFYNYTGRVIQLNDPAS